MGNSLIKTNKIASNDLFYIKSNDIIYNLCESKDLYLCYSSDNNTIKPNLYKYQN